MATAVEWKDASYTYNVGSLNNKNKCYGKFSAERKTQRGAVLNVMLNFPFDCSG
jgi:hypothetical protein